MFSEVHTIVFSKEEQLTNHIFPDKLFTEGGRAILCHVLYFKKQFFPNVPHLDQWFIYLWLSFGITVCGAELA